MTNLENMLILETNKKDKMKYNKRIFKLFSFTSLGIVSLIFYLFISNNVKLLFYDSSHVNNQKKILRFDSILQLRDAILQTGQIVFTENYFTVDDGGGSKYYIRKATIGDIDDSGSIIKLKNGNVAVLEADKTVNISQFGARGNAWYYNTDDNRWYEDCNFSIPAADDSIAIQNAINYAASTGNSVTITACPENSYYFSKDIIITTPHITIDMKNARIVSNARFHFKGNKDSINGALEDDSLLLEDVHFCNANFGDPNNFDVACRGPKMEYVLNSSISNCTKNARGGTSFNLSFAKNCQIYNVHNYGARPIGEKDTIGILLYHTINCVVKDCTVGGPGQWIYGVQQKGGYDNQWVNITCHDMSDISRGNIIRDRGDAPYHASSSKGPYPYKTGNWAQSDNRRASHNTKFINCTAFNIPPKAVGFKAREARGTKFIDCKAKNARGIYLQKDALAPVDYDDHYEIINFTGENVALPIGISSNSSIPIEHAVIDGVTINTIQPISKIKNNAIVINNVCNLKFSNATIKNIANISGHVINLYKVKNSVFKNIRLINSQFTDKKSLISIADTCFGIHFIDCSF